MESTTQAMLIVVGATAGLTVIAFGLSCLVVTVIGLISERLDR
jgi:hypothetical protein